jgi:hypothetical protein
MSDDSRFTASVKQRADQPHHRLGVFLGLGIEAGVIDLAGFDFAQDAVERKVEAVELVDAFQQLRFARQQGVDFELAAERGFQLVERDDVEHVGGRQRQHVARRIVRNRQQMMAARELLGHQMQRFGVGHHLGEVDALAAECVGELVAQHRLGHEAERHQLAADRQAGCLLFLQADAQLVEGDEPLRDQGFAHAEFLASFHGQALSEPTSTAARALQPGCGRSGARRRSRALFRNTSAPPDTGAAGRD